MIEHVVPNFPAEKAGLQELDVITALDGKEVFDVLELSKYLYNHKKVGDINDGEILQRRSESETTLQAYRRNSDVNVDN